jgi:proteasome lid subunit RPN8/RPN11
VTATEVLDLDLPAAMRAAILEHAVREAPNEACGLIVGDAPWSAGGRPLRWLPTRNALASPYRYEIDPVELLRLTLEIDAAGEVIWAIVHSHVASPAVPSPSDIREALYPEAIQLIVSVATGELRVWRIDRGPS